MKKKKFCLLLPNKKPYKPNKPHLFNKPNNAKWPNKPNKPNLFNKPNKAKRPNPAIQQTQQSQTAQQTQQLSAQAHPLQQFQQFQLQQSQQSQTTASGTQMSATSSSTPIFIDSDDREIVILRSRSRATIPGVETDVLAEFGDIAIRGTSVDDRSPVRSRRSTPVIEENIFFFQAEDGIRDVAVTGVQTCALPI